MRAIIALVVALVVAPIAGDDLAGAAEGTVRHGVSAFGDLKYGPDFTHFDYVDPNAPKGGTIKLYGIDSYDSLNPYILKGVPAEGLGLIFETLMTRAEDEPDALYGLIAESIEMPEDRAWAIFTIRPEARWWDGRAITADDVVFSYQTLITDGHPRYRVLYRDFERVEALAANRVRFTFGGAMRRDLPLLAATMPILSRAYWSARDFTETTLEAPLSSGPYRIETVDPGRSLSYRRVVDYWGRDLPVNRGRYNFDVIRYDYYRDRSIAREAFFAGNYDFREEFTSKSWVTGYDKPPVEAGLIRKEVLPDNTPSGVQAFFFNTRRKKFSDRRVREALNYAFDFEWTNRTLFFGLYDRTTSMFENSELAAKGPPSKAELKLLEPYRDKLPEALFERPFAPPTTTEKRDIRKNLVHASRLLRDAGWRIKAGAARNADGEALTVEFLLFEATMQRIIGPYIQNLERIGVKASIRIVDVANFERRVRDFDYDVIGRRFVMSLTPGVELRNFWTSDYADTPGGPNLSGVHDPVVDALVEKVIAAKSRPEMITAARALDRVLMWGYYIIPNWYKGEHNIAYWDKFDRPALKPKYARGVIDTWWVDAEKARLIAAGIAPSRD